MKKSLIIYIDGAARGNPGPAGIGIVIADENNNVIREYKEYLGKMTNNAAEYNALLKALQISSQLGGDKLSIFCDSELVVNQIRGEYRIKNEKLKELIILR